MSRVISANRRETFGIFGAKQIIFVWKKSTTLEC